jgi:hypothetical protein
MKDKQCEITESVDELARNGTMTCRQSIIRASHSGRFLAARGKRENAKDRREQFPKFKKEAFSSVENVK